MLVIGFWTLFFHSVLQLCDDGYEYSLFFDKLPANNRHGDAAPKWAGERAPGMSPCKEQVCERHATPVRPDSVAAFHDVQFFLYPSFKMLYLVWTNVFFCFTRYYVISFKSIFKTRTDTVVIYPALCVVNLIVRLISIFH